MHQLTILLQQAEAEIARLNEIIKSFTYRLSRPPLSSSPHSSENMGIDDISALGLSGASSEELVALREEVVELKDRLESEEEEKEVLREEISDLKAQLSEIDVLKEENRKLDEVSEYLFMCALKCSL